MFIPNEKLLSPIEFLKGVGPIRGDLLRKELNIDNFGDLLFHFPFRYEDKSCVKKIKDIVSEHENILLVGKIIDFEELGIGAKKRLVAVFSDGSNTIELLWFRGIKWLIQSIKDLPNVKIYGKPSFFKGRYSFSHPEMERINNADDINEIPFYPIYPSTEKLKQKNLSGNNYTKLVGQLLEQISLEDIPEILPQKIIVQNKLPSRLYALQQIHFPSSEQALQNAKHRFCFEELFIYQLHIAKLKMKRQKTRGFVFEKVGAYFNTFFHQHLPFELTPDQKQVLKEIRQDTKTGYQMNRLLQGDVGSGKTIVALLTMLLALDNQYQACLIAPTEILAQQHFLSIKSLLQKTNIQLAILTGKTKVAEKKKNLQALAQGEIQIIVGTHALLEEKVVFHNLGLCIIDEQHRFGVAQRAKMWQKNNTPPHILVMTATPIPRTLAMTSYGDLEISEIKNLPPGRQAIRTVHRKDTHRSEVFHFMRSEIAKGRQVYIVYPLIEESEKLDFENLQKGYELVSAYFPSHSYNIAIVHGRQNAEEREHNMQGFVSGKAQILVATTVIEVGVDVPNATVMLIESAERFGLAQLHQLRGRVGRGAEASYCILLTGNTLGADAKVRMKTMVEESSGFAISEKDLELRGPGEIQGTQQSGTVHFKIANLIDDVEVLTNARKEALELLKQDPFLISTENKKLKEYLSYSKEKEMWAQIS